MAAGWVEELEAGTESEGELVEGGEERRWGRGRVGRGLVGGGGGGDSDGGGGGGDRDRGGLGRVWPRVVGVVGVVRGWVGDE
jgi:hypothetical protein